MKRILVIDNYDSFTYNLVHMLRALGHQPEVWLNDAFHPDKVDAFEHILLSPGPGLPGNAGHMPTVIKRFASAKNVLGVCLGHQGIAEVFGSALYNLPQVYHGVATSVNVCTPDALFEGLPNSFQVCRYHSWAVQAEGFGPDLEITATDDSGQIMALRHKQFRLRGVQFHPESIMTDHGMRMIENWLKL
jgi:anthranilate synthase component 2